MAKVRKTRRVLQPRIEWQRRLHYRRLAPPLVGVALFVLLLVFVRLGSSTFQAAALTPASTPTEARPSLDVDTAAIGSMIRLAEMSGQVQPALPSVALVMTDTPRPPTPTLLPSLTPTAEPTATETPVPPTATPNYILSEARLPIVDWELVSQIRAPVKRAEAAFLEPMAQVYQKKSPNEAPSIAAMMMSFYGLNPDEVLSDAQAHLPLDEESQVALPGALVKYFEGQGVVARIYESVTLEQLQSLITNGIPVIVAQTLTPEDDIPHYRVVRGYSDLRGVVIANDPEFAANLSYSYAEFAQMWTKFEGFAMPVFLARQASVVTAILGEDTDKTAEYVERDRKLGQPSSDEVEPALEPGTNAQAEAAWPLRLGEGVKSHVVGNSGGAYGFLRVEAPTPDRWLRLTMAYAPDDPIIARAVGFKVYAPDGKLVGEGVNTTGRGGERTLRFSPAAGAIYLIQVYNYSPGLTLEYTMLAMQEGDPLPAAPVIPIPGAGSGEPNRPAPTPAPGATVAPRPPSQPGPQPTSTPAPRPTGGPVPPTNPPPTNPPPPTSAPEPTEVFRPLPRPTRPSP